MRRIRLTKAQQHSAELNAGLGELQRAYTDALNKRMSNRISIPAVVALAVLLFSILNHGVVALGLLPPVRQEFLGSVGAGEQFGSSVAITPDGTRFVLGGVSGRVYVYDRNTSWLWEQTAYLSDPTPYFGQTIGISLDGNMIAVGAPGYSFPSGTNAGAIFIFQFDGTTWTNTFLVSELLITDNSYICSHTLAISYDGNTIVCDRGIVPNYAIGVDVFFNNGTAWEQQGPTIIVPPDGTNDIGGLALSSNGSVLVFGAPYNYDGRVYVYTRSESGIWSPFGGSGPISALSSTFGFGSKTAISADASVIAVLAELEESLVLFVLVLSGQTYEPVQTIPQPSGTTSGFGLTAFVMSPSGNRIVIGDTFANLESNVRYGGAFIYDRLTSLYNYTGQVSSTALEPFGGGISRTGFGYAISVTEGNEILVGALLAAQSDGKLLRHWHNCY